MKTCLTVKCKYCKSKNVIKYGHYKATQLWLCKDCKHKFTDNQAIPGLRTPSNQMTLAVDMYYKGIPLDVIGKRLNKKYNTYISNSTIYRWVNKFPLLGFHETRHCQPTVGDTWFVNQIEVKIGPKIYQILDVIDIETYFLIVSKVHEKSDSKEIDILLENAILATGKHPKQIVGIGNIDYLEKPVRNNNITLFDLQTIGSIDKSYLKSIKLLHSFIKDRNKVFSYLKSAEQIEKAINGWLYHYNYFGKIHNLLNGINPAERAQASHPTSFPQH